MEVINTFLLFIVAFELAFIYIKLVNPESKDT